MRFVAAGSQSKKKCRRTKSSRPSATSLVHCWGMAPEIFRDARIRVVEWRDLTHLTRVEIVKEICLSLPWLALSLWLAQRHWFLAALPASFMFFLVGLRQVHNAYHYALGLSHRGSDWVMFA